MSGHGHALWHPSPLDGLHHISIGDVGYLYNGAFIRIFNATLPWDDLSNTLFGKLEEYVPLNVGKNAASGIALVETKFGQVVYRSPHVFELDDAHANTDDE